jgi:prepilin-type N-terminal cleavage/methylation domain-containing protein
MMNRRTLRRSIASVRGFTLLELLVVMGILILLSVLTGISVSRLSGQARLSSGVNTVLAALGSARAYAIQNNVTTMVTFQVKIDPARLSEPEIVAIVVADSTGVLTPWQPPHRASHDRDVPVTGIPALQLPRGIKVAGPLTADYSNPGQDQVWVTQPGGKWRTWNQRPVTDEIGRMICVLFAADGTMVMRDPGSSGAAGMTAWPYLDMDLNRKFEIQNPNGYGGVLSYVAYDAIPDEGDVLPCQWLAVYDDEEARKSLGTNNWTGEAGDTIRKVQISDWVNSFGIPIHFNRYTGVAEIDRK